MTVHRQPAGGAPSGRDGRFGFGAPETVFGRTAVRRSAVILGAVAVAAVLVDIGIAQGVALSPGRIDGSLLLAVPVGLALMVLAAWRSEAVLLGIVGLVAAALVLTSPVPAYQQSAMLVGLAVCAGVWGARTAIFDKGRWPDLVAGALIAWASAAWLFEVGASLHPF